MQVGIFPGSGLAWALCNLHASGGLLDPLLHPGHPKLASMADVPGLHGHHLRLHWHRLPAVPGAYSHFCPLKSLMGFHCIASPGDSPEMCIR